MILFLARMEHKNALKIWKAHLHSLWDWFFFFKCIFFPPNYYWPFSQPEEHWILCRHIISPASKKKICCSPLVEVVRVAVVDSSSVSSVSRAGFMRMNDGANTTTLAPWLARCRAQFTPSAPCRWGPHKKTTVGRWWSLLGTHLERWMWHTVND